MEKTNLIIVSMAISTILLWAASERKNNIQKSTPTANEKIVDENPTPSPSNIEVAEAAWTEGDQKNAIHFCQRSLRRGEDFERSLELYFDILATKRNDLVAWNKIVSGAQHFLETIKTQDLEKQKLRSHDCALVTTFFVFLNQTTIEIRGLADSKVRIAILEAKELFNEGKNRVGFWWFLKNDHERYFQDGVHELHRVSLLLPITSPDMKLSWSNELDRHLDELSDKQREECLRKISRDFNIEVMDA